MSAPQVIEASALAMAAAQRLPRTYAWRERVGTAVCSWRAGQGRKFPQQASFGCALSLASNRAGR